MTPEASVASGVIFFVWRAGETGAGPGALGEIRQTGAEDAGGCGRQGRGTGGSGQGAEERRETRQAEGNRGLRLLQLVCRKGRRGRRMRAAARHGGKKAESRGIRGGGGRCSGKSGRRVPRKSGGKEAEPTGRAASASSRRGDQTSKSISRSSRVRDFQESCPGMTASATPRFIS